MKYTNKKRKILAAPQPIFSWSEIKMIKNVCFACLVYETQEGILFKKQARKIIKKLQTIT